MSIPKPLKPALPSALLSAALALSTGTASAQADNLEGALERGATHSVLWFASPETGDLIGQAFANDSQAGQTILARCLPDLGCAVEAARFADEAPQEELERMGFSAQPSGWTLITHARDAYMLTNLPLQERELQTRHGRLSITDDHRLLFNDRAVLDSPPAPPEAPAVAQSSAATPAAAPSPAPAVSWTQRLSAWWQGLWGRLLALFGRAPVTVGTGPADATAAAPVTPISAATPAPAAQGTADLVQGNSRLDIVAHFELEGQDIVLLQDTGGTACPALFRFATLTSQGIAVTPEFGTCSDIATVAMNSVTLDPGPELVVSMAGYRGPFESEQEQQRAYRQLHRFTLRQGVIHEQGYQKP